MNRSPSETDVEEETLPFKEQRGSRDSPPPGGFASPGEQTASVSQQSVILLLSLSVVTLLMGLLIAVKYKDKSTAKWSGRV